MTEQEWYSTLEMRHGKELQQKFTSACIAICGLGGLGSNIANSLARVGIGKLILIDFDRVDITNLHRQQYKANQIGRYKTEALCENLAEIAPYLETEIHTVCITEDNAEELLKDSDTMLLFTVTLTKTAKLIFPTLLCLAFAFLAIPRLLRILKK